MFYDDNKSLPKHFVKFSCLISDKRISGSEDKMLACSFKLDPFELQIPSIKLFFLQNLCLDGLKRTL